jgi:N-acyl amino acid synthase of PEP-CTERM/exosortase system
METDAYDDRSQQCLLRHRTTGEWAGLVRLVLAEPTDPGQPFPTEVQAQPSLDHNRLSSFDRREIGEISRLIVAPNFRKRRGENSTPYGSAGLSLPLPLLGLLAGAMRLSAKNDVKYWLAVMEPHLNRLLRRLGVELEPIGPAVSFCGTRFPCFGEVSAVLAQAKEINPQAWSIITEVGTR